MKKFFILLSVLIGFIICGYYGDSATEIIKSFRLVASEPVSKTPEIYFVDSSGKKIDVVLEGTQLSSNPIIFEPTFTTQLFIRANRIADGTGTWYLVPDSLVDLAGNSGDEITSGTNYYIVNPPFILGITVIGE